MRLLLWKSSDKFNFGDSTADVYGTLDEDDLSSALADGTYDDGSIDEDYSQEISLGNYTLKYFHDEDVNNDDATVGFKIAKNNFVLNYTMDFDGSDVNVSEMAKTDMPLLGSNYYVLSADKKSIELLDTADKTTLELDESVSIGGRSVTVTYIGDSGVKFTVDGETTDTLDENEQYELDDGSYIIATDIMTSSKDSVSDSVEFSIGSGKIELFADGDEIKVSDDEVDGLSASYNASTDIIDSITLTWTADEDLFLYEGETLVMPLFENIKVTYNGLEFPSEAETITMSNSETFTIEMDNFDLPLMWVNDTGAYSGEEYHELVMENTSTDQLTLTEGDRFIVTKITDDLSDVETLYYEVETVDGSDSDMVLKLEDLIEDNDLEFDDDKDKNDRGDITLSIASFPDNDTVIVDFAGATDFNKVVSDTGLVITLPSVSDIENLTKADVTLSFQEADEDDNLEEGAIFTATVTANEDGDIIYVKSLSGVDTMEESDNDLYIGNVASELASKVSLDKSGDENDFKVEYYGEEVTADVEVIMGGEVSTSTTKTADFLPVKASELSSVQSKNLIVVGGSCVNSAAATLLGGALCGEEFTAATSVGTGQFIIEEYVDAFTTGKTALLVAGYEEADTVNAVTYLTKTEDLDTSSAIVKGLEAVQDLA